MFNEIKQKIRVKNTDKEWLVDDPFCFQGDTAGCVKNCPLSRLPGDLSMPFLYVSIYMHIYLYAHVSTMSESTILKTLGSAGGNMKHVIAVRFAPLGPCTANKGPYSSLVQLAGLSIRCPSFSSLKSSSTGIPG